MAYMAGRNSLREIADIFGVGDKRICDATIKMSMRGVTTIEFTHVVDREQFEQIKEVLRNCAEDVEIRHGLSFSGEVHQLDMAGIAGE